MSSLRSQSEIVAAVDERLRAFLQQRSTDLAEISPVTSELMEPILQFTAGGKRVRPVLSWWGFELAGGQPAGDIAAVGASLELLHAAALIHDDIIDAADTRRGQPAVHTQFQTLHQLKSGTGDGAHFGTAVGIIAGDLCLVLSQELMEAAGFDMSAAARIIHAEFRSDVMAGQYLDVRLEALPVAPDALAQRAWEVLTYKAAKYSIEQPLLLGAALAGAKASLLQRVSDFGLPLGQAFQLRDDELGVFGDPAQTGKPAGDDLRQGKRTVLVAETLHRLPAADAQWFSQRLGARDLTPDDITTMREMITSSGALDRFEDHIESRFSTALTALADLATHPAINLDQTGYDQLAGFARKVVDRRS